jgi:hypothetical protein
MERTSRNSRRDRAPRSGGPRSRLVSAGGGCGVVAPAAGEVVLHQSQASIPETSAEKTAMKGASKKQKLPRGRDEERVRKLAEFHIHQAAIRAAPACARSWSRTERTSSGGCLATFASARTTRRAWHRRRSWSLTRFLSRKARRMAPRPSAARASSGSEHFRFFSRRAQCFMTSRNTVTEGLVPTT